MLYHLHSGGRTHGVFPKEELQRRRQAGELNGAEWVWAEGMENWVPLDSVLHEGEPTAAPPPAVVLAPPRRRWGAILWIGGSAAAVCLVAVAITFVHMAKYCISQIH